MILAITKEEDLYKANLKKISIIHFYGIDLDTKVIDFLASYPYPFRGYGIGCVSCQFVGWSCWKQLPTLERVGLFGYKEEDQAMFGRFSNWGHLMISE